MSFKSHGLKVSTPPPTNTHAWKNPRTGVTQFVPDDLDPGWDHNPGKKRFEALQNALREKAGRLPSEQRQAIMASSIEPANRRRTRIYEALKGLQQLTNNNAPAGRIKKPRRSLWADFPDVLIQADETTVKKNPHYKAAKEGDLDAAVALLSDVLDAGKLKELIEAVGSRQPIVVPVMAVEGRSVNVIPSVFAEVTAGILQTSVSADIIQINRVAHTGAGGFHRLATPALFAGDVVEGADYLIVDDFVGQGGTLANIRGYIERHGARVIFSSVLAGKSYSARIALSEARLSTLREKHGEELENWWRETYGYDFRFLTESEARYLERTQDADTIRAKLAAALLKAGEP